MCSQSTFRTSLHDPKKPNCSPKGSRIQDPKVNGTQYKRSPAKQLAKVITTRAFNNNSVRQDLVQFIAIGKASTSSGTSSRNLFVLTYVSFQSSFFRRQLRYASTWWSIFRKTLATLISKSTLSRSSMSRKLHSWHSSCVTRKLPSLWLNVSRVSRKNPLGWSTSRSNSSTRLTWIKRSSTCKFCRAYHKRNYKTKWKLNKRWSHSYNPKAKCTLNNWRRKRKRIWIRPLALMETMLIVKGKPKSPSTTNLILDRLISRNR